MGKVSVAANIKAKSGVGRPVQTQAKPLSLDQAIELAEAELTALRGWVKVDPRTPYRREVAARLHWLADAIAVGK